MSIEAKKSNFGFPPNTEVSDKGQLSNLGLALSIALLTLTLIHYTAVIKGVKAIEERAKHYLCLRHFLEQTTTQIKTQKHFNLVIQILNMAITAAMLKPPMLIALKRKKKLTITLSQLSYARYLQAATHNRWCPLKSKWQALNSPFKSQGMLLRRSRAGHSLRKKQWHFSIPGVNFTLQGRLQNKSKGKILWHVQEAPKGPF